MRCGFCVGIDINTIRDAKSFAFGNIAFPLVIRTPPTIVVDESYTKNGEINAVCFDLIPINGSIMFTDIDTTTYSSLSGPRRIVGIHIYAIAVILNC